MGDTVMEYWKGKVVVDISLPPKAPVCARCELLSSRYGLAYCIKTKEPIPQPEKYRGDFCPIEWEEDYE